MFILDERNFTPPTIMTFRQVPLLIAACLIPMGTALSTDGQANGDAPKTKDETPEVGSHAEITGTVRSVLVMDRFGHVIIRFEDHKVYLFCRSENVEEVFSGLPAEEAVRRGDLITARGRVELYRNDPQIVLRSADQITLPERQNDN